MFYWCFTDVLLSLLVTSGDSWNIFEAEFFFKQNNLYFIVSICHTVFTGRKVWEISNIILDN